MVSTLDPGAQQPGPAPDDLLVPTREGWYCPLGDFHIDPRSAVARAVITHAHADHARRGHGAYLAAADGAGVLRARLGAIALQTLRYAEPLSLGGVQISLHPAGHILGSAQVRVAHRGRVWVVSGDYYLSAHAGDHNPTCPPFEPQRCDCFITESTFGLPLYRWQPQAVVLQSINAWWQDNARAGRTSVLLAYSLGKTQRLLAGLNPAIGPLAVHPSVPALNAAYAAAGVGLPATRTWATLEGQADRGQALWIVPPGATERLMLSDAGCRVALASGWMQLRRARQAARGSDAFVLSDHADWPGLLSAIEATGASRVIVTHGPSDALTRWLKAGGRETQQVD